MTIEFTSVWAACFAVGFLVPSAIASFAMGVGAWIWCERSIRRLKSKWRLARR